MFFISIIICIFIRAVAPFHLYNVSKGEPEEVSVPLLPSLDHNTNRIVGGQKAVIEDFPHQIALYNGCNFCGGFIISENYVVTAGHCIKSTDPSGLELRVGSSWRTNGTVIDVAEVIIHPYYNHASLDNDITLLRTSQPIEFIESVQPVKLPQKGRPVLPDTMVEVSGWGRERQYISTLPEHLRSVEIPVVDYDLCRAAYHLMFSENEWCGGNFLLGGKSPCMGDSGGAAVQDGMAVGITSYSRGCALPLSPVVFTDVAAPLIRDFITKETGL